MKTPGGLFIAHADHDLRSEHMSLIDDVMRVGWEGNYVRRVIALRPGMRALDSRLYGPEVGDKPIPERMVHYCIRGTRSGMSRMIEAPLRKVRSMVVIAGPGRFGDSIIYTAYGGRYACPREWWEDMSLPDVWASAKFWREHALALGND